MREYMKNRSFSILKQDNNSIFITNSINRRHSCHCQECGKKSDFQIRCQNIQPLTDSQIQEKNELIAQKEAKRLESLEKRLKTQQDDLIKIKLESRQRRKSCHCSECGYLTTYEIKYQDIPLITYKKMQFSLKSKIQKRAHLLVSNIQTKSQFFYNFKYHTHQLQTQINQQKYTTTTRLLKESKLKLIDFENRLSVTPKLYSPKNELSSPQNFKISSTEVSPKILYPNPYLTKKKFLSPPRNLNFRLPPLSNSTKEQSTRKYFFPKRDF